MLDFVSQSILASSLADTVFSTDNLFSLSDDRGLLFGLLLLLPTYYALLPIEDLKQCLESYDSHYTSLK
jgi:hypothetical protein